MRSSWIQKNHGKCLVSLEFDECGVDSVNRVIHSLSLPPFLPLSPSQTLSVGADVTDYFNYGFTEETWKAYCEKQRKMRGEVASLNKIVVSSLPSRNSAWTTDKRYSKASHTHTIAQMNVASGWTYSIVVLIRYNVKYWFLCNEFDFVMNKDDIDTTGIMSIRTSIWVVGHL